MPSYRFCRPDDLPLLLDALNNCFRVHFPGSPEETVASFKQEVREIDLWASSCMIAQDGEKLIGIVAGCKRKTENLIYKVGVHPEYQRLGHAEHLLTSLSAKLAVLGPPKIVAELPASNQAVNSLFEKLEYQQEYTYTDLHFEGTLEPATPSPLISEMSVEDLSANGVIENAAGLAWIRQKETLENRKDSLRSIALVSPSCVEAYLLYEPIDPEVKIYRSYCASKDKEYQITELLLRHLHQQHPGVMSLPRFGENASEVSAAVFSDLGFVPGDSYHLYVAAAKPM